MPSPDRSLQERKLLAERYACEMKRQADPTDAKQQFGAIYLAAASNDHRALQITLAAGYSVHDVVEGRPFKHFDHTALHIYAWYNNNPNECVDLLINAGAVALSVAGKPYQSPAHVAASRGHHQLLKVFERYYGKRLLEECPGLLQLAIAEEQREVVKFLLEIGAPVSSEVTWMYFSPLTGACDREILPPLHFALEHAWTDVASILIDKHITSSYSNGNFASPLRPTVTSQEAMVRLLIRWADIDTDGKDEFGQTQLSWAARLGYQAVVQLLVDWEQVAADSRDKSGRTPLSWAASNGHMSIVQTLAEREDIMIDSRDNSDKTPLLWGLGAGMRW
jgi:ankyrin repeat protein